MSKLVLLTLLQIFTTQSTIAQVAGVKDLLRDPAISIRCKALMRERDEKIAIRQKLTSLLERSKSIKKSAPSNRKSALTNLEITQGEIQNYLRFVSLRVRSMEENIVRKGCPGIAL